MKTMLENPVSDKPIEIKIADEMPEYAYDHWRDYIEDGYIAIDEEGELERAYERIFGQDLPKELYKPLLDSPEIQKAFGIMREMIQEQADDHKAAHRYYNGTMHEQLRERGMSIQDFI